MEDREDPEAREGVGNAYPFVSSKDAPDVADSLKGLAAWLRGRGWEWDGDRFCWSFHGRVYLTAEGFRSGALPGFEEGWKDRLMFLESRVR